MFLCFIFTSSDCGRAVQFSSYEKYLLVYHPNVTLMSAVYIILANVNELLCSNIKFSQDDVVDFIPAFLQFT